MIPYIIMTISLLLDGLLTNYLPYLINDLTWFTPMLTLVSIFILYPFYRKREKKYLITVFILGMIYDLFYTNLLFFNASLFFMIGYISIKIQKNFDLSYLKIILYTIIVITTYESLTGLFLWLYHIVPITIPKVLYKISHSLILNIIYLEIVYYIIKIIPKKYKKISIN